MSEQNENQSTLAQDSKNQSNLRFQPPLDRAKERVTKKPFGIYVTPQNSPVQPERFQGFHTGTDFEIFPEELDATVPVRAICSGKLVLKTYAGGYGGVAVQSCERDDEMMTVVYGHLDAASINFRMGDNVNMGDAIGNLGAAYGVQTDRERKHLHLGLHKGSSVNITGYVNSESQLSDWINPCSYVCE